MEEQALRIRLSNVPELRVEGEPEELRRYVENCLRDDLEVEVRVDIAISEGESRESGTIEITVATELQVNGQPFNYQSVRDIVGVYLRIKGVPGRLVLMGS